MLIHHFSESQPHDRRHHSPVNFSRRTDRCIPEEAGRHLFPRAADAGMPGHDPWWKPWSARPIPASPWPGRHERSPAAAAGQPALPCVPCRRWCCSIRGARTNRPSSKVRRMKPPCASTSPPLLRKKSCCSNRQSRHWPRSRPMWRTDHLSKAHRLAPRAPRHQPLAGTDRAGSEPAG